MGDDLLTAELPRLSDFIADAIGLDFPPSRWNDLQRGLVATSKELGFATPAECARRFLAGPIAKGQIETLATHLTVGETYFMREYKCFELLAEKIIPALLRRRRNGDRRLRIWSAACCTGEEAYSIAILLHQSIPQIADWNITLLATDINARFLCKAAAGVYGQWSFRQVPAGFRERYFRPVAEQHWEILPHIKQMVRFAPLNLVEDVYPALANETNAMDVIFCRNVLMYFTPQQARKVVENLHRSQIDGGWLLTGGGELSHLSSGPYAAETFEGSTHYRKSDKGSQAPNDSPILPPLPEISVALVPHPIAVPKIEIPPSEEAARPPKAESCPESSLAQQKKNAKLRRAAQRLANRGRLSEALECCDRWVAADRLNPSGHYLRAIILQERGAIADAVKALRGALYLDPNFVLAHFALGNIERNRGRRREAGKHLENAQRLLRAYGSDDLLPESEGVTVGRFTQIISSLLEMEAAA
jgi:chemotaxis protein methyltransferase CheR